MTGAIFDLRVNTYSWDLFWDESGSIGSHQPKIKKIPCQEKFSAPPKDDPQKLGFFRRGSAENGRNGKNWQKWVEYK